MKHTTYFNLLDALKEDGCPICALIKKSIRKSMDDFLYGQVNDPAIRKQIKESFGFCNRHAWQFQKLGNGFSLSIIYRSLSESLVDKIDKKEIRDFQRVRSTCMICKESKETERRYMEVFIENYEELQLRSSFKDSFGFCLTHLLALLKLCKNKEISAEVLKIESAKIKHIIDELKEFERKYDYRFSKEEFGKESNSWIRAIEKLIGKEGV
jgi:hypothetical protein